MCDLLPDNLTDVQIKDSVIREKIAAAIYNKRMAMGLTQKEFADFLNVSQGMISKWENLCYSFTVSSLFDLMDRLSIPCEIYIDSKPAEKIMK
ncbi:MAG: helix-turn-helix domain-containing protein [Clostridia bacterium]|nr:helix-turn-helix domain-containing protein [Clostridia bacterium]